MPVISITLLPGYSPETEQRLVNRVAQAARSVIAASSAGTTVFVHQASTYQRDGRVFSGGGAARVDACALVRDFLQRMQNRQLADAALLLTPDFSMRFPASPVMHKLEELVSWAHGRYQQVGKNYEKFDESWGDESCVVYCFGTLHGIWLDGTPFEGIRFVDRFEIVDGLIQRQDVWNDLAETQAQRR
ncbi:hypothetical protein [Limnohabitans sp.]|jgi:phenylpyruvate tautomerase PptA (4-oxalocrotonate tautomerase family)|uniref:hypothetical protein n=1 Tax=Limnohabitans sp. TaxID=1907725 RepID=UPI0037BE2DE2